MPEHLEAIYIREKVIKLCRQFFDQQHFHEVIPSVLNRAIPSEATLFPFVTTWKTFNEEHQLFLSVSPESSIKKMLAKGMGNSYALGKCFRNLESSGSFHNPEFLMLEWYRINADMQDIIEDVKKLLLFIASELEFSSFRSDWQVLSLNSLYKTYVGVEIKDIASLSAIKTLAASKGYAVEDATWEQLFDQIYLNEVEPHLPQTPFFLIDYPAQISPLCRSKKGNPDLADRFEFFLNGVEIGNGNSEETDVTKVTTAFEEVRKNRKAAGQDNSPLDTEFLESLTALQDKKIAGIGLGIDRLAMFFAGETDIKKVEPFSLQ